MIERIEQQKRRKKIMLITISLAILLIGMAIASPSLYRKWEEYQLSKPENQYGFVYIGDEKLFRQILNFHDAVISEVEYLNFQKYAETFDTEIVKKEAEIISQEQLDQERSKYLSDPYFSIRISPESKLEALQPLPNVKNYLIPFELPIYGAEEEKSNWERDQRFNIYIYNRLFPNDTSLSLDDIYISFSTTEDLPQDILIGNFAEWYCLNGKDVINTYRKQLSVYGGAIAAGGITSQEVSSRTGLDITTSQQLIDAVRNEAKEKGLNNFSMLDYPELWDIISIKD